MDYCVPICSIRRVTKFFLPSKLIAENDRGSCLGCLSGRDAFGAAFKLLAHSCIKFTWFNSWALPCFSYNNEMMGVALAALIFNMSWSKLMLYVNIFNIIYSVSISQCNPLQGFCCGDILLSLCYHSKAKTVEMVVVEINNLKKSDFIGLSSKCQARFDISH